MTYDASNRKDIRRAEKDAKAAEIQRLDYLKAAMSMPQGRAWFYTLLESCHLFADPFTGDPLREAYLKGERNVGLALFADIIAHCPDDYIKMVKEANGRRIERDIDNARNNSSTERPSSPDPGRDFEGREPDLWDPYGITDGADLQ
jgi:hypothetical protein